MLLKFLQKIISGGPYYIKLRANCLTVRDVATQKTFQIEPIVALSKVGKPVILAIGAQASHVAMESGKEFVLVNGFSHPRSMIADFAVAEKTLLYCFNQLTPSFLFKKAPIVILHPLEQWEGGLTQIEVRALQELAAGAGAREAYIWMGRELTDEEIQRREFPGAHWLPDRPPWAKNSQV